MPASSGPLVVERPSGTLYAWWLPGGEQGARDQVVLYSALDTPRDVPGKGLADRLTPRELQVLTALTQGMRNAEIAQHVNLSPRTVEKHLERIYKKLGVHSRTGAMAAFAVQHAMAVSQPAWGRGQDG